jgi:murein DD-endopeptidase MepM/ murein hydrolase activator NlpD
MKRLPEGFLRTFFLTLAIFVAIIISFYERPVSSSTDLKAGAFNNGPAPGDVRLISDRVRPGESFSDIFKRYGLDPGELHYIGKACSGEYDLGRIALGRTYSIYTDREGSVQSLAYCIDDYSVLNVSRTGEGFRALKNPVEYDRRIGHVSGTIKDNLVSSMASLQLALELSDIFAWDIDFTTDLRDGDMFRVVVEELWLDGELKRYGKILGTEFVNNGTVYYAYRFGQDGKFDYYDRKGNSLRRAFLKAPLSYRRISSGFTKKRFHPVLRKYRPHLGIDYAARRGTPVSTVGDGTVIIAGYRGRNGKQVVIKHVGGYRTYYGHLSRIKKGIRKHVKVRQGQVIGYVGSTGRATGPHLDYRIKKNGRFINPLKLRLPRGRSVKPPLVAEFRDYVVSMDARLASMEKPTVVSLEKGNNKS